VTGVSIGFDPVDMEPMNPAQPRGPQRYLKSELLEISFVAIPANTGAGVVQRAFTRHRAADTVAALHRRWRAEGMPSYRDRVAEVREAFGLAAPRVREISQAERQADLMRLADAGARRELKAAPVFRGDVATYAAEMRAFIERETLRRSGRR